MSDETSAMRQRLLEAARKAYEYADSKAWISAARVSFSGEVFTIVYRISSYQDVVKRVSDAHRDGRPWAIYGKRNAENEPEWVTSWDGDAP